MKIDTAERQHLGKPPLVLTVEDDHLLRAVYKQLFVSSGLRCIPCCRPDEALHVIFARPPNLVTVDYDLPGMPGTELAQIIRGIRPDIPLLLLTGRTWIESKDRVLFAGVHHKGEETNALIRQIQHLLFNSLAPNPPQKETGIQVTPRIAAHPDFLPTNFGLNPTARPALTNKRLPWIWRDGEDPACFTAS